MGLPVEAETMGILVGGFAVVMGFSSVIVGWLWYANRPPWYGLRGDLFAARHRRVVLGLQHGLSAEGDRCLDAA